MIDTRLSKTSQVCAQGLASALTWMNPPTKSSLQSGYNQFMPFEPEFIRGEIENQSYLISLHADDERLADGLTIAELEAALTNCEVIESYPEDPRGESCLALAFIGEKPVHVVCGKNRAGHLGFDYCVYSVHAQVERPIHA